MQDIPFWKAILITLGVFAVAGTWIYIASILGLKDPWVPFVAVTLWSAIGMKMEQAPGIFIGGAVGLLLALGIEALPDIYGEWTVLIPVVGIVLAVSCVIKEMFPLVCNFSLFLFLTIGGADVFLDERPQVEYLRNLAFGALCFWLIPWAVMKVKSGGANTGESGPAS